jgi:hypothetical protein
MRVPSPSARVRPSDVRSALVAGEPSRTSAPARRSATAMLSPTKSGSPGSSRGSDSTSVTCEPNAAKACVSSHPADPPPSTMSRRGRSGEHRPSAVVQAGMSDRPSMGGATGSQPVAITRSA